MTESCNSRWSSSSDFCAIYNILFSSTVILLVSSNLYLVFESSSPLSSIHCPGIHSVSALIEQASFRGLSSLSFTKVLLVCYYLICSRSFSSLAFWGVWNYPSLSSFSSDTTRRSSTVDLACCYSSIYFLSHSSVIALACRSSSKSFKRSSILACCSSLILFLSRSLAVALLRCSSPRAFLSRSSAEDLPSFSSLIPLCKRS